MNRSLFFILLILLSATNLFSQTEQLEELTEEFLNKYVSNGAVEYKKLSNNRTELEQLVQLYGMEQFSNLENLEAKAFFINSYNIFVIEALVNNYPIASPQEIEGFFTAKNHLLAGERISLNAIEKEKLDAHMDSRLHFALVCGAKGCPPLANFSFKARKLDSLLNLQTHNSLNNDSFIQIDTANKEVQLSQIFIWYKADFKKVNSSFIGYINSYRTESIPSNYKTNYYKYDWTINSVKPIFDDSNRSAGEVKSNLQLFTPSALFEWGEYEVNLFNSLYYQNSVRDAKGKEIALANSQAFFNSLIQITSGIPNSRRINVGIDINVTTARYGDTSDTPVDFLNNETATYKKTILSSIGPRIKYVPLLKVPRLSIQSTFLFPIAADQENPFFIFHDRYTWFTQLFFDQNLGDKFQIFLEADLLYRFNRDSNNEEDFLRVPLSAFLSYFPTSKSTIYLFSQYSPRYENVALNENTEFETTEFGLSQWFTQLGVGAKYQLTPKLGMELSYADFILSNNDGAGYAVNFGLRYIHR